MGREDVNEGGNALRGVNYHWAKDPVASSEAQVHQTQPQKWELRSIGHDTCG